MTLVQWNLRCSLILVGLTTMLSGQVRPIQHRIYTVEHKCPATGRFIPAVPTEAGTKQYCFDGKYYNSKTVPSYVVEYFVMRRAESDARMQSFSNDVDASLARAQQEAAAVRASQGSRGGQQYASQRSGGNVSSRGNEAALLLPANTKPAPAAVPMEKLRQIAVGDSRASVKEALKEPHGSIAGLGSGDEEIWTYVAEGGAFAKVHLKAGVVKSVSLP